MSAHREEADSPWYSTEGAEAAGGGKRLPGVFQAADVAFGGRDPAGDIDGWMMVPFHRFALLAPWAEVAGYGASGTYPHRVGAIALRGRPRSQAYEIKFPAPDGSISNGSMFGGEWPNPLSACPDLRLRTGYPITLALGGNRPAGLVSYSLLDVDSGTLLKSCGFDADSYLSNDSSAVATAKRTLTLYGAAVLISKEPLVSGHTYKVSMNVRGRDVSWNFSVNQEAGALPVAVAR
jgi:hypothetical protein